jgi:hypothetical protein
MVQKLSDYMKQEYRKIVDDPKAKISQKLAALRALDKLKEPRVKRVYPPKKTNLLGSVRYIPPVDMVSKTPLPVVSVPFEPKNVELGF